MHNQAMLRVLAHAGLWSMPAFVLNLAWEIAQVRLYTIWDTADSRTIAWALFHCTLGDVMIALVLFALAAMAFRRIDWPLLRPWAGGAMTVICALAFTLWSEWSNVYRAGNWAYKASMPTIFNIGVAPLLQWLILPPVTIAAFRLVASFGGRIGRASRSPNS